MPKNKKQAQNSFPKGNNSAPNQNKNKHTSSNQGKSQGNNTPKPNQKAVKEPKPLKVTKDNKYVLGGYFGLGLNNFFKAILSVLAKTGIKVASSNGTVLYPEEKIGAVLRTLYYKVAASDHKFTPKEQTWSKNFNLNVTQQELLKKLLFHHFPILSPILAGETYYKVSRHKKSHVSDAYSLTYGVTLAECLDALSTLAQGLVDCRNSYTHYDPHNTNESLKEQYEVQSKIVRYLDKVMVASRRIDKERNNIDTKQMEFLTGCADNLKRYISLYGFYPKYDKTVVKDEKGRTVKKMVERDDFFYKIGEKMNFGGEPFTVLSGFGLTYFCAIFLSKSQTKQMLADIKLFEASPYPPELNEIVREIMCIYRIRAPRGKKKLESGDSKITLALDILNELRKCPKELFDVLTPKGQEFFEEKIESGAEGGDEMEDIVKRIRHTDRFSHLAMKYIDETKLFNNIRFQVQLGKFRFKFYDKKCINGEVDLRSLQKEINGFGRIQEIEPKRKEKYKDILQRGETDKVKIEGQDLELDLLQFKKDTEESAPYITDSRAFYNIHNNRIGLYWNERLANGMTIPTPGDYIPELEVTEDGKAKVEMPAPMALMSIYELPALVFYQYLLSVHETDPKKLKKKSAERLIIEKCQALRQFFSDVSSGALAPMGKRAILSATLMERYGLKLNEVPDKLVEYLSGAKPESQAKRKAEVITQQLIRRLRSAIRRRDHYIEDRKKIGDKDNKYAKKTYVDVRHGALGRYLSESLVEWQPTKNDGKDKLTGMNFNKLQAELATFSNPDKFDVIRMSMKGAGMLSGDIAHPFLSRVMSKRARNIEELYRFYLDEEIKYLKSFLNISYKTKAQKDSNIDFDKTGLKQNVDISAIPFVRGKARWEERSDDYYCKLAKRYLEVDGLRTSIWLPDGIFTKAIAGILKECAVANPALSERLANEELNNNVAYLINAYYETILNDHSQVFYRSFDIDSATGKEKPNKFARVYDLFNILNNEKVRNTLVEVPMTCNGITARLTEKAVGYGGEPLVVYGPKNKPMKSPNGAPVYMKQINVEINDRVAAMGERDKGNHATLEDAREAMRRRLLHCVSDVKNNERAIRRYKTQDMVLFLIAAQLLGDAVKLNKINELNKFSLKNVCSKGFLSQTINFEFPIEIDGKTVYVSQDNMSLKNYGEFYHLLNDDRLPSLLSKLAAASLEGEKNVVDYNKLMGELTSYDLHRSHIFHAIHQLEKRITSDPGFKPFLRNPSDVRFYIDNDKTRMAKRNNFRSLLTLLEEGDTKLLKESERELIISIRNAFSHNHYNVDFNRIASRKALSRTTLMNKPDENDKDNRAKLTTIATLISARLEELQNIINRTK